MRLARARHPDEVTLARFDGDNAGLLATESVHPTADVLREVLAAGADLRAGGRSVAVAELQILAPVRAPSKIIAAGLNYVEHARESVFAPPSSPVTFAKLPSSIAGPDDVVVARLEAVTQLDYEAELAAVIGSRLKAASEEEELAAVFGYTAANDLSARDAQFADGQWARGRSFDGMCPVGPVLGTADEFGDPQDARVASGPEGGSHNARPRSQDAGYLHRTAVAGVEVAPHQSGGPVATATCLHLAATVPNFLIQEHFGPFNEPWTAEVVNWTPRFDPATGRLDLPSAPGPGLELNLDVVREHPYDPKAALDVTAEGWERRIGDRGR